MGNLLARTIPLGFGAAVSPVLLVFVVLLLSSTDRPRARAAAFAAGATAVLVALAVVILRTVHHVTAANKGTGTQGGAVDFALGILLAAFAVGKIVEYLRRRSSSVANTPAPGGDADPPAPKRARGGVAAAALEGVALMATNLTTLALYVAALKDVAVSSVATAGRVVTVAVLTAITMIPVLVPCGIAVALPRASDRLLGALNRFVTRNRDLIMAAFFGAFGIYLIVKGLHHH